MTRKAGRQPEAELRRVSDHLRPYLFPIIQSVGITTDQDIRRAILKARTDGIDIGNIGSERSLRIVHEYVMGERV